MAALACADSFVAHRLPLDGMATICLRIYWLFDRQNELGPFSVEADAGNAADHNYNPDFLTFRTGNSWYQKDCDGPK